MAKFSSLKTDGKKEVEGVWRKYPGSDVRFKIARLGNPNFDADSREFKRIAEQGKRGEKLSEREAKDAAAPAVARHILVGWENLQDDDGAAILYSQEKAVEILKDPEAHDLYDWVMQEARDAANFRASEVAGNLGNS